MLKLYIYTQSVRTPSFFFIYLEIFRELLNINKAYIKTWLDY